VSFLSYNVAGLKSKVSNSVFLSFVKMYDVFILVETFVVKEDFIRFEDYFMGYNLRWVSATRAANRGRASGGILIGIKSSISPQLVSFFSVHEQHLVQ